MLQLSQKPEVIRLHDLENQQRNRFVLSFQTLVDQPSLIKNSRFQYIIKQLLTLLPDAFYTFVTLCVCKRRLGEEYTYVAMHQPKHFEEEGVLLAKKTRILLAILELVTRHAGKGIYDALLLREKPSKLVEMLKEWVGSAEEAAGNVQWLMLMAYLLGWNKFFTCLETIFRIQYVYTYKTDRVMQVSYAVEGYLLLFTFIFKFGKALLNKIRQRSSRAAVPPLAKIDQEKGPPKVGRNETCRICFEELQDKSVAKCGHVFCWGCICKSTDIRQECPVCRSPCSAREVIQLRNL